jgi:two-component system OmpR family response regulator
MSENFPVEVPPTAPRILVIDDEPRILNFIARALDGQGFRVDRAADGRVGAQLAMSGRYDLVILDLVLPDSDGTEILTDVLAHRPEQRVLCLSALSDVQVRVRCLDLGAIDYLPKPFALSELVARVRARIRQPAATPREHPIQRVGPVELDLVRRTADAGSGHVRLSDREFLLLRTLADMHGEIATREELLQRVWNIDFATSSNVVEVYIGRLRAKLGPEVIETVRNAGYLLAGS